MTKTKNKADKSLSKVSRKSTSVEDLEITNTIVFMIDTQEFEFTKASKHPQDGVWVLTNSPSECNVDVLESALSEFKKHKNK